MSAEKAKSNEEFSPTDKYAAVRDPGATPRRNLKNDNVAVVHSSDLDSEPNTEMYEAYEGEPEEKAQNEPSAAPRKDGKEEVHKTIP